MSQANLRERTLNRMVEFAAAVSRMLRSLPYSPATKNFRNQLTRSASSIGANFAESNAAESRNDFIHKLSIALKEAEETRFWIQCIEAEFPGHENISNLFSESCEFIKILQSCVSKAKRNQ